MFIVRTPRHFPSKIISDKIISINLFFNEFEWCGKIQNVREYSSTIISSANTLRPTFLDAFRGKLLTLNILFYWMFWATSIQIFSKIVNNNKKTVKADGKRSPPTGLSRRALDISLLYVFIYGIMSIIYVTKCLI